MKARTVALKPPVSSRTMPKSQVRREIIMAEKTTAVVMITCRFRQKGREG
jgi:hypothetical protein